MTIQYKKIFLIVSLLSLLIIVNIGLSKHTVKADVVHDQTITITSGDLAGAGYTKVTEQQPEETEYQAPNTYFWVDGASANNTMINNTFGLVAISQYTNGSTYTDDLFNYGTTSSPVTINDARAQETKLNDGRVALNFAKGNYYIVIIGPDSSKVENLAQEIAGKI
jgi:hypothetical protein